MRQEDFLIPYRLTALGAFIGFGLSFTTLSPLIIGGIIGCSIPLMCMASATCMFVNNGEYDNMCKQYAHGIVSAVVGVGLGAASQCLVSWCNVCRMVSSFSRRNNSTCVTFCRLSFWDICNKPYS